MVCYAGAPGLLRNVAIVFVPSFHFTLSRLSKSSPPENQVRPLEIAFQRRFTTMIIKEKKRKKEKKKNTYEPKTLCVLRTCRDINQVKHHPFIYFRFFFHPILLNKFTLRGNLSPIQIARSTWFRSSFSPGLPSSSVFGWTSADRGPLQTASQGMKAPNWAGVWRFTSNMGTG